MSDAAATVLMTYGMTKLKVTGEKPPKKHHGPDMPPGPRTVQ